MSEYIPNTDEVETAFHEYASQTELSFNGSYPEAPEFADWREAMWGFRRWHAEEIRKAKEEATDEATEGIATWIEGGTSRNYGARYWGRWDSLLLSIVDGIRKARNPYREDEHEI